MPKATNFAANAGTGEGIYIISQQPATTPYPDFASGPGYQPTAYSYINTKVQQDVASSTYSDLRLAYQNPLSFPPSTLLTYVVNIKMPEGLSQDDQADWHTVHKQLKLELTELVSLYNFWTELQISTNSISVELNDRFQTASNTLNDSSTNGDMSWLEILVSVGLVYAPSAEIATVMGIYLAAANTLMQTGNNLTTSGDLSILQQQLSSMLQTITAQVTGIYVPISQDWGRLQAFYNVVATASVSLLASDLASLGNQYEELIYQAVIPSTMSVVSYSTNNWGSCSLDGSTALGYTPIQSGASGCNTALCSRLVDIGVNFSHVLNRQGNWGNIPAWACSTTDRGTNCWQTS